MRKPGDRIGSYELIRRIGRGGMAEVFLARRTDDILNKDIVIKLMHSHLAEDERFIKMFLREARIAARMNHTNVVQMLEVGSFDEEYYLAMEYLDGASLQSIASRAWTAKMTLPLEMCARAIGDSALGLHYAHNLTDEQGRAAGLVHRDISPDNLFVTRSGVTKVLDFGIATGAYTGRVTRTGELKGKVRYMSPEQIDGLDLDSRSDIFSLGVTSYRLLTGRPPFDGANELQCMRAVMEEDPPPPSKHNPHLPRVVDDLVMSMLEKDKVNRIASGEEIYEVLGDFDGGSSGRRAVTAFLERVFELPMSNKLDVPTWVTSKRPAAAPAAGTLSGPVQTVVEVEEDPALMNTAVEARLSDLMGGEEPAESSQPETAELGEAAAALRSRVANQDTVVARLGMLGDGQGGHNQEEADVEKTQAAAPAPLIVEASAIDVPPVPGASSGSKLPLVAIAGVVVLLLVGAAIAMSMGGDDAAGVRVSAATGTPKPATPPVPDENAADENAADENAADENAADENAADENAADENATDDGATDDGATDDGATDDGAEPAADEPSGEDGADADAEGAGADEDERADGQPDGATGEDPAVAASDDTAVKKGSAQPTPRTERRRRSRRRARSMSTAAKPAKAMLVFRVVPYGVITVDGRELGTTPLKPYELSAGRHNVVIRYKDKTKRIPVRVKGGERKVIRANMSQ